MNEAGSGPSATVAAVSWIQDALLGNVATLVAVIAVAALGLAMLAGRVDLKRGATVILGCFIIFGAASIADGLRQALASNATRPAPPQIAEVPIPHLQPAKPTAYDPYAGAAVPQDR